MRSEFQLREERALLSVKRGCVCVCVCVCARARVRGGGGRGELYRGIENRLAKGPF